MTRWGGGLPEMRLDSDVPGLTNPTLQKCPDICPRGCKKALEAREAEEEEAEEEAAWEEGGGGDGGRRRRRTLKDFDAGGARYWLAALLDLVWAELRHLNQLSAMLLSASSSRLSLLFLRLVR